MAHQIIRFAAAVWLAAGVPADAQTLTLSGAADYSSGHYGQAIPTEILFESVSGKLEYQDTAVTLTVPYLRITGPADFVPDTGVVRPSNGPARSTREGLGDITIAVDQDVTPDAFDTTSIDLIGKVKLGTADEKTALGTGENDYYAEIDLAQTVWTDGSLFAAFGRRFTTDTQETLLHDVWYASAGGSWKVTPERSLGAMLDFRQHAATGAGNVLEATVYGTQKLNADWKLMLYVVKGFAPGSPALGGGLVLSRAVSL